MKYIKKNSEPENLIKWKRKFKNKNGRNADYSDLRKDIKVVDILKNSLLAEQNNLCGYCCSPIDYKGSHIEHIRPKGVPCYFNLSLEYSNLMASCYGSKNDCHCGKKKDNEYDELLFISPYEENCNNHFSYGYFTGIVSGVDESGCYMVELLNLNADNLKNARRMAYLASQILYKSKEELLDYISSLKRDDCNIPYCDMLIKAAEERLEEEDAF